MKSNPERKRRIAQAPAHPPEFSRLGDVAYWRTRTPRERMQALDLLRQKKWGYTDETAPRLVKVMRTRQMRQK
jgi:hypothetical protein